MSHRLRVVPVIVLALGAVAAVPSRLQAQRAVFVTRRAERADGGMAGQTKDPDLSIAGRDRAERLAALLAGAGVTAVYATEYRRTVQTVEPLARRLGVSVQQVPASDTQALIARIRAASPTDVIVVAGHSNTVPDILEGLGHPDQVTIADGEYDNLFVLVPRPAGPPVVLRLSY